MRHSNTSEVLCSLNLVFNVLSFSWRTSIDLEYPQLTCSDDGDMIIFTTTVVYSSDAGDITASDMIDAIKSWAAINGVDASLEIGGDTATGRQVFIIEVLCCVD